MKEKISQERTNENTETDFVRRLKKTKSDDTQRIIRLLSNEVRKSNLTYETLKYIYQTVVRRTNLSTQRKKKKLYRLPTSPELDAFFSVIKDPQELLIFQLMLSTGARCGEVVSIEIDKIDYAANTILVSGKTGERILIITPRMGERIKYFLSGRKRSQRWLFVNKQHRAYSVRRIEQLCAEFKKKAGIDASWSCHGFRHFQLSNLSSTANLSLSVVQRVAGHAHIQTTQIYQNLGLDASKSLVLEKLQELENKNVLK